MIVMQFVVGYNSCKQFEKDRLIKLMSDGLDMTSVSKIDFHIGLYILTINLWILSQV